MGEHHSHHDESYRTFESLTDNADHSRKTLRFFSFSLMLSASVSSEMREAVVSFWCRRLAMAAFTPSGPHPFKSTSPHLHCFYQIFCYYNRKQLIQTKNKNKSKTLPNQYLWLILSLSIDCRWPLSWGQSLIYPGCLDPQMLLHDNNWKWGNQLPHV